MKVASVLVIINQAKGHSEATATKLKEVLDKEGIDQQWIDAVHYQKGSYGRLSDLRESKADLALVCGGDGTLIQTAHRLRGSGIPMLGINIGYLGFITSIPGNRMDREIRRVLNAEYNVQNRMALDITVMSGKRKKKGWALNDVLVARGDNPHLISVSGRIDGKPLTQYRCDGLIAATPTGSTAYSLAAGGPIISPECHSMVITPICPQALTNRSVVINEDRVLEMCVDEGSGEGVVQVDGMNLCKVKAGQTIEVRASKDQVPLAFLPEVDFFDTLTEKLQWHGKGVGTPKYYKA